MRCRSLFKVLLNQRLSKAVFARFYCRCRPTASGPVPDLCSPPLKWLSQCLTALTPTACSPYIQYGRGSEFDHHSLHRMFIYINICHFELLVRCAHVTDPSATPVKLEASSLQSVTRSFIQKAGFEIENLEALHSYRTP
jgi:hypothetical protein